MKWSLVRGLSLLWLASLSVCIALGVILRETSTGRATERIQRSTRATRIACAEIQEAFARGVNEKSFSAGRETQFAAAILEVILNRYPDVEGGVWTRSRGHVAYAFPTHDGVRRKQDLPDAERPAIESSVSRARSEQTMRTDQLRMSRHALIITACLPSGQNGIPDSTFWTMTRVSITESLAYEHLSTGLGILLAFAIGSALWVGWIIYAWSKDLRRIERGLTQAANRDPFHLEFTKEVGLDRIVRAFNEASDRASALRAETNRLQRELKRSERLAALGKIAAGIAHEIRNPMATLRLKLENAMIAPEDRLIRAAPTLFEQIDRVDRLIHSLLASTHLFEVRPRRVQLRDWMAGAYEPSRSAAESKNVRLRFDLSTEFGTFDPVQLGRALENVLANAVAYSPEGEEVVVRAERDGNRLNVHVRDAGPGLSEKAKVHLFEPFFSERVGGTGLGLMLAREVVEAHGGKIWATSDGEFGTTFTLEVPCRES